MTSPKSTTPNGLLPMALGTVSFAVCFTAWGLIAAFAPRFRDTFHLSATQAALMVAVPVLLGSLARLPVGMLADRFGGRLVFSLLMLLCAVPAFLTPIVFQYWADAPNSPIMLSCQGFCQRFPSSFLPPRCSRVRAGGLP